MKKYIASLVFVISTSIVYADSKVFSLTADTSPVATNLTYEVINPGGTPLSRKITIGDLMLTPGTTVQHSSGTITNLNVVNINGSTYPPPAGGGGGGSPLAIGTGTDANFTTLISSPTNNLSFLNSQFLDTASGTTNFVALNGSSVTLQGTFVPGTGITLTPSGDTTVIAATGGSGGLPLPPGDTNYIQNTNSLQQATFYVLVGTVSDNLNVGGPFSVNPYGSANNKFSLYWNPSDVNGILHLNQETAGQIKGGLKIETLGTGQAYFGAVGSNNFQIQVATSSGGSFQVGRVVIYQNSPTLGFNEGEHGFDLYDSSITFLNGTTNPHLDWNTPGTLTLDSNLSLSALSPGVAHLQAGTSNFSTGLVSLSTETIGVYISSLTGSGSISFTGTNNISGAAPILAVNFSSITAYGTSIPAASIATGNLGGGVMASSFPATGVTAGSYTHTDLTVDAYGRITAASNDTTLSPSVTFNAPYAKQTDKYGVAAGMCTIYNGCVPPTQYSTSVSSINYIAATFKQGATSYYQLVVPVSSTTVSGSTYSVTAVWTSTAASGNVAWFFRAFTTTNAYTLDGSYGTAVTITQTASVANSWNQTADTPAMTPAGPNTNSGWMFLQAYRQFDGTDTLPADAQLLGIEITRQQNKYSTR